MKKFILAWFLVTSGIGAYDSIGLVGLPLFLGTENSPLLYWNIGATFGIYRIGKSTLLDLGSNKDYLDNNSSKVVPGLCFDVGREFKSFEILDEDFNFCYGLKLSYAGRNRAVKSDYFESNQQVANFQVQQDVRDLRFTPYISVEGEFEDYFNYGLSLGFGIGVKTLDHFKLYEKATNAYTGQRLASCSMSYLTEIGGHLCWELENGYITRFDYTFTIGNARYKRRIFIDNPDSAASTRFQDQILLIDKQAIMLPEKPKLKLRSHRFAFIIGKDF